MSFIYCLNTSTIGPQPLMEKIRLAGKHGFAGIELWHDDVFAYVEQGGTVADVNKAVADEGLIVPCTIAMKGWCEASDDEYSTVLEDVKRRMNLAAELGSPYIVATPAHVPVDYEIIKRRYKELLELGREIGVKPTFEYLGFCVSVYRIDQALEIVTAVDDPDATILLDAFHNYRGGSTFDDLTKVPLHLIGHYHLDDAPADPPREQQRDPDRVMPGDGILDLAAEIQWLRDVGYDKDSGTGGGRTISLELFNPGLWKKDPDEVLALGMERMKELLG
ncbi:MAG: sugar phosphate isomerase/epimerase [Planctomycetes bacterium]|nr:sugar phosphate isomerase/epimerase [Planctomycetota bacterium]